jgi:hypothetical protein
LKEFKALVADGIDQAVSISESIHRGDCLRPDLAIIRSPYGSLEPFDRLRDARVHRTVEHDVGDACG